MIKLKTKYLLMVGLLLVGSMLFSQQDFEIVSVAERPISPSYRIAEKPVIIDTVIPIPAINYPLLSRNMQTEISIEQIEPSKIKIVDKLEKLYTNYAKLGLGNYNSPLGELYINSSRNRRMNIGAHVKHNSSFGNINGYAPSGFDNTTGHLFGEFFTSRYKLESELNYLNNGYHFYGIEDTLDLVAKDSLVNRVQGIGGAFKFSNFSKKDSAKIMYSVYTDYMYFNEFLQDEMPDKRNARNGNFGIGTALNYKHKKNVFALDFEIRYNKYKFAEGDQSLLSTLRRNENNTLIHLRPTISTYGDKWKVIYGVDVNFDLPSGQQFKVVPVIEAKYSLFNNMFIPYAGIGGGVQQNTFYSLNRENEFINSSVDVKNTKEFKVYAGIKGTLSKKMSFDFQIHSTTFTDKALFVNDTFWVDMYRFKVVYDKVSALGLSGSFAYQANEKLKIDLIAKYNQYTAANEEYAWNLPEFDASLRGSYNIYDKIYIKTDLRLLAGRKSPGGLFTTDLIDDKYDLGFVADANLHLEYRYNSRISAFLQFNNLASQKYFRWNRYRVQGFQVMGGVTFAF